MKPVEKLAAFEAALQKLTKERDGLNQALGDPTLVTWTYDGGPAPRKLTSFEVATVKRIASLDKKLDALDDECEELLSDVVRGLSGIDGEPDDPEVLLRASLVVINRLHRVNDSLPESRAVMKALLRYLKSLKEDDDG